MQCCRHRPFSHVNCDDSGTLFGSGSLRLGHTTIHFYVDHRVLFIMDTVGYQLIGKDRRKCPPPPFLMPFSRQLMRPLQLNKYWCRSKEPCSRFLPKENGCGFSRCPFNCIQKSCANLKLLWSITLYQLLENAWKMRSCVIVAGRIDHACLVRLVLPRGGLATLFFFFILGETWVHFLSVCLCSVIVQTHSCMYCVAASLSIISS